jgi:hypothetical protein
LLDRFADRLPGPGVAARRYARQHALEHSARERVLGGEVAVGGEPDLVAAVARPDPGALDLNAPPAEGHLTGGAAVAVGRALCVVAAPGPGDFGDLVLHRLVEHGSPVPVASASNPSFAAPAISASETCPCSGSACSAASTGRGDLDGV